MKIRDDSESQHRRDDMSFMKAMASASLIVALTAGYAVAENCKYGGCMGLGGTMALECIKTNWADGAQSCTIHGDMPHPDYS